MRKPRVLNFSSSADPYMTISGGTSIGLQYWKWGSDNLWPKAIAIVNRKSTVHRGILNNKARYISGKQMICDEREKDLAAFILACNSKDENLQSLVRKVKFDHHSFGNGFIEVVTNSRKSFIMLFHQDATRARLQRDDDPAKDKKYVFFHHDWTKYYSEKARVKKIPIYPVFEDTEKDGTLRSIIHIKDYEPEFENYGLMDWAAGLGISAIAYKTDKWNISRLDNSFNNSGVLIVPDEFEDDKAWEEFTNEFDNKFIGEGKQGKILLMARKPGQSDNDGSKLISVNQSTEGDWVNLHSQAKDDLIVAHNWFRSLSGLADNTGFDTKRILNEYEVALNTVILEEQQGILNLLRNVLGNIMGWDCTSLSFINKPPVTDKPIYMKVWEARKADGLDYDENDPGQQIYLAALTSKSTTNTEGAVK